MPDNPHVLAKSFLRAYMLKVNAQFSGEKKPLVKHLLTSIEIGDKITNFKAVLIDT